MCAHDLNPIYAGETGFLLIRNPNTVRAPDAAFITRDRVVAAGKVSGYWAGAPDLVVEVISPGDLYTEVAEKVADWLAAGTRFVYVVDPRRQTVTIHSARHERQGLAVQDMWEAERVVPGWRLLVADIFRA
jgi:Uma2 family endonuclease